MTTLSDEELLAQWEYELDREYGGDPIGAPKLTRLLALARRGAETRIRPKSELTGDEIEVLFYSPWLGWAVHNPQARYEHTTHFIPLSALGTPEEP